MQMDLVLKTCYIMCHVLKDNCICCVICTLEYVIVECEFHWLCVRKQDILNELVCCLADYSNVTLYLK